MTCTHKALWHHADLSRPRKSSIISPVLAVLQIDSVVKCVLQSFAQLFTQALASRRKRRWHGCIPAPAAVPPC